MSDIQKDPKTVSMMFTDIAPFYDRLNRTLSLSQDIRWRKKLIREAKLPENGLILDVCTGTGDLALGFLTERPDFKGNIVAIDFSASMIDIARGRIAELGAPYVSRVDFLMGDALDLNFADDKFDYACVAFGVRNFVNTSVGLREIFRVLKPGAEFGILEFFSGSITNPLVKLYLDNMVPWIGNSVSRTKAYSYLQKTSNSFYTVSEFSRILENIGFSEMRTSRMTFGISHIISCKKNREAM